MWGFLGNSIVVFASKELDFLVLINYIVYYILISYIVNRKKYETMLGKFIVLPGSAAIGAFTGYKLAQIIAQIIWLWKKNGTQMIFKEGQKTMSKEIIEFLPYY